MTKKRIFEITYLPATDYKPHRVKVYDPVAKKSKILSWDYNLNSGIEIAERYLKAKGFKIYHCITDVEKKDYIVATPPKNTSNTS